jgi:secreted Zn-dependent insulinase-like peptidase
MLPRALEALCDVFEAKCEKSRLEKERAAVLSEMTMVNTIDYRVECQILAALHAENMLSRRFPIGKLYAYITCMVCICVHVRMAICTDTES